MTSAIGYVLNVLLIALYAYLIGRSVHWMVVDAPKRNHGSWRYGLPVVISSGYGALFQGISLARKLGLLVVDPVVMNYWAQGVQVFAAIVLVLVVDGFFYWVWCGRGQHGPS